MILKKLVRVVLVIFCFFSYTSVYSFSVKMERVSLGSRDRFSGISCAAFSPANNLFVVGTRQSEELRFFNAKTGKLCRLLAPALPPGCGVYKLKFSPNGRYLACVHDRARFVSPEDAELEEAMEDLSLEFSSSSFKYSVTIYKFDDGSGTYQISHHFDYNDDVAACIDFSADSRCVGLAYPNSSVFLWDMQAFENKEITCLNPPQFTNLVHEGRAIFICRDSGLRHFSFQKSLSCVSFVTACCASAEYACVRSFDWEVGQPRSSALKEKFVGLVPCLSSDRVPCVLSTRHDRLLYCLLHGSVSLVKLAGPETYTIDRLQNHEGLIFFMDFFNEPNVIIAACYDSGKPRSSYLSIASSETPNKAVTVHLPEGMVFSGEFCWNFEDYKMCKMLTFLAVFEGCYELVTLTFLPTGLLRGLRQREEMGRYRPQYNIVPFDYYIFSDGRVETVSRESSASTSSSQST
ncbi:hypothetical protein K2X40_04745 [Candidatus Babeliales bacterium]|nr:hypothetical protein [Candidatus Babeliales bacterium]